MTAIEEWREGSIGGSGENPKMSDCTKYAVGWESREVTALVNGQGAGKSDPSERQNRSKTVM